MPLDTYSLDEMEFDAWATGVEEAYFRTQRNNRHEGVVGYHAALRDPNHSRSKSGLDLLRDQAREHLLNKSVRRNYLCQHTEEPPFARIGQHVVTGMAIDYFQALKKYHQELEKSSEGGDIEEIRQNLGRRYALLLRQFDSMILTRDSGGTNPFARRMDVVDNIGKVIDKNRLRKDAHFWIGLGTVNHFEGITVTSRTPIARIHGQKNGIDPVDFLQFLHDKEAVEIHFGESNFCEETVIAVLCTNGVVEMKERGQIRH